MAGVGEVGKSWPELPGARQRAVPTALIERIDVGANQIKIHLRAIRLGALLDVATPLLTATDDETQIPSVPIQLRRAGRESTMRIDGTDQFATAKPDARLIKLVIRARRFNTALVGSDRLPFAALASGRVRARPASRGLSASATSPRISPKRSLDGRQPCDLTEDMLLAHSRLPLAWHAQRSVLGFA